MEMLWRGDNISYVQGPAQALVIIATHMFQLPLWARDGRFRGMYRPTGFAAKYLVSLSLAWAERGIGALYISIFSL